MISVGYIISFPFTILPVNITDPDALEYRFLRLVPNTYKFTVTAYTQIGEGVLKEVSINIPKDGELLVSLFSCLTHIHIFYLCTFSVFHKITHNPFSHQH